MSSEIRRATGLVAFLLSLAVAGDGFPAVAVSAIMYNPPGGETAEYLELQNAGVSEVDVGGWRFSRGIAYTFPEGTALAPGARVIVARSPADLDAATLDADLVLGPYEGALDNGGELLTLVDGSGGEVESFRYDDDIPWEFGADGFGLALIRRCFSADPSLPETWRGGLPGGSREEECPPEALPRPPVFFSEIMYHPVREDSLEDEHEFVELHNAGEEAISLAGWRIAGGIDFAFPETASIPPGGYLVVARNPEALAAIEPYGLAVEDLLGPYEGTLDNGGERVALLEAAGKGADQVVYDDDAPWPVAADAFGAGESWLPRDLLPLEEHRYMGRSLERVSFELPSNELAVWDVSPVDGATPGRPNASARDVPLPVVSGIVVSGPDGEDALIRSGQEVRLQASFTPSSPSGPVELEYFVDLVDREDEDTVRTPLRDDGTNGDFFAGDGVYTTLLEGRDENTVIRYRVLADRGSGIEPVAPRPSDPNAWHAYFVSPVIDTDTRVYQLFISPANWGRMWTYVSPNRVNGCTPNRLWDEKVFAVLVHDGEVHDVRVRYQGSRWNRTNGPDIPGWRHPRPSTGPLRALSWRISFPRYNQLEGQDVIVLNKLRQSCPGYNSGVGFRLFAMADLPSPLTRFARLHVNGGYYHYMIEYERPGEDMIRRYNRELAEKYPDAPREEVGHLYKSSGCNCDEGPYGWGDERILGPLCGFTAEQRYAWTYDRKIHEWADHKDFMNLIEELHRARREGVPAMRDYFAEHFDLDLLFGYIAIMNWSVPFDDMFQNHFLYQRRSDGKWMLAPWDLDRNFGEWRGGTGAGPAASIFVGEAGDRDNRSGWWNRLKDAFFKAYREEYQDHLLLLNNTLLHPDNVNALVDRVTAEANPQEAAAAPAGLGCSFPGREASFKLYAAQRHEFVNRTVAGAAIDAGADQTVFVGATVQFDARESTPDPGPDVTYTWDNGMEGESPTFVFEEPGVFEVTLTVMVRGIPFSDSVTVTVMPVPDAAFVESDGQVALEGESFFQNEPHGQEDVAWEVGSAEPGFSGTGYAEAVELVRRRAFLTRYGSTAPELRYAILFESPGTYRVWVRALASSNRADSLHANLGSIERSTNFALQFESDESSFTWSNETRREGPMTVEVAQPGLSFLSVWMRESGIIIDKIVLTQDEAFVPDGLGPRESDLRPVGEEGAFVRGDVDGSGRLSVADATAILFQLFRGTGPVSCEDHGDVDDNGDLELTDAVRILAYLFRSGDPPAAPFPAPGFDETPDDHDCGGRP